MVLKHIRSIILTITFLAAISIYLFVNTTYSPNLKIIRLVQIYALTSISFLYITLLTSPLYIAFPHLPGRSVWIKARRALGLSAFTFAILHAYFAFFKALGGFDGLSFLGQNYITPILFGLTTLTILSLMTLTSNNTMMRMMGNNWKRLHRLVYIAGLSIIFHALKLGSHFVDLSQTIPFIFVVAVLILLLLETYRIDNFLKNRYPQLPRYLVFCIGTIALISLYLIYAKPYVEGAKTLSIHGKHQKPNNQNNSMPGMIHQTNTNSPDKYKVAPKSLSSYEPETDITIPFQIVDITTEKPISLFQIKYEKIMHAIIVDSSLSYYEHIHPEQVGTDFNLKTSFPQEGTYYIYLNYSPLGSTEQVDMFTITAGSPTEITQSNQKPETNFTKIVDNYEVTLIKQQPLTLEIKDNQTKKPITDLQPYLGAFGHLAMIHQQTQSFIHVHPTQTNTSQLAGPSIEFLPMSLNNIDPEKGVYRIFIQFKHNDKVNLVDFTIQVE
jgi:DMSO/TMAO reductase YedYZ heme-binding membrane subunit